MIATTLRQHRMAIVGMAALVALITVAFWEGAYGASPGYDSPVRLMFYAPTALGGLFAVFWAAPLLAREYENRTHLFAWGQDVSPVRWLAGKVVVLAAIAAGLSAITGAFTGGVIHDVITYSLDYKPFDPQAFDSDALLMAAHTLFGFGLGLLAGAITRLTLPAMGLTLFFFVGVRGFITVFVRPYYLTPYHEFQAWKPLGEYVPMVPPGGLRTASGYADVAGNPVEMPGPCRSLTSAVHECVHDNGVAGHFAEFQTAERVPTFQLIETGVYLGLAVILFVIAFVWVQRRRRV
jgi:ABC-type transport system involved in multi-copper enzyme maturation permease subunit